LESKPPRFGNVLPAFLRARCYVERVSPQQDPFPICAACGRTLLKGEQAHEYVNPQGQRLGVCVLCRTGAEASGWIPADQVGAATQAPQRHARRGEALRKRLERAASRARTGARGPRDASTAESEIVKDGASEPAAKPEPAKPRRRAQPKGRSAPASQADGEGVPKKTRPRRGPEALMRHAVERFNDSRERRKVAGLIRSLGKPRAAISPDPSRQMALVTVAWELSWYQWEVVGDGQGEPVREVAKGDEVSDLAEDAQAWNAAVAEDGTLRLGSRSPGREASGQTA
jgi:hypothetical protein